MNAAIPSRMASNGSTPAGSLLLHMNSARQVSRWCRDEPMGRVKLRETGSCYSHPHPSSSPTPSPPRPHSHPDTILRPAWPSSCGGANYPLDSTHSTPSWRPSLLHAIRIVGLLFVIWRNKYNLRNK